MCKRKHYEFMNVKIKEDIIMKEYYTDKLIKITGVGIKIQNWGDNINCQWKLYYPKPNELTLNYATYEYNPYVSDENERASSEFYGKMVHL